MRVIHCVITIALLTALTIAAVDVIIHRGNGHGLGLIFLAVTSIVFLGLAAQTAKHETIRFTEPPAILIAACWGIRWTVCLALLSSVALPRWTISANLYEDDGGHRRISGRETVELGHRPLLPPPRLSDDQWAGILRHNAMMIFSARRSSTIQARVALRRTDFDTSRVKVPHMTICIVGILIAWGFMEGIFEEIFIAVWKHRRKKGHCPSCGYRMHDARGHATCPECGEQVWSAVQWA